MVLATCLVTLSVVCQREARPPTRNTGSRTLVFCRGPSDASTLDVVQGVKNLLPRLKQTLPEGLDIELLSDQSLFVTASINDVVREATIAALLTALMILIF